MDSTAFLMGNHLGLQIPRGLQKMSDPKTIRRFEYRPCRINAGIKVDFVTDAGTFHGLCRDVSDTGIRAWFDGLLELGNSGVLTLRHPAGVLELEGQIAYVEEYQVGLTFIFRSPWERRMTVEYIASIANQRVPTPVIPFP
jgi:hypothetical protein